MPSDTTIHENYNSETEKPSPNSSGDIANVLNDLKSSEFWKPFE